jgi:hypothetical protein
VARRKLDKSLARINALTLRRIAEGTLKARRGKLHDGGGLYVFLRPGGGSWVFKYQIARQARSMGLGSLAQVAAPHAREMAREYRAMVKLGDDPLHHRKVQRRQQRAEERAGRTTFRDIAQLVLADYDASAFDEKTRRSWRQVIETYAYPVLGNRVLDDIEHGDILDVLRPIWAGKPDTARKARRRIEHIFDEARTRKLTSKPNPARYADLRRSLAAFVRERRTRRGGMAGLDRSERRQHRAAEHERGCRAGRADADTATAAR